MFRNYARRQPILLSAVALTGAVSALFVSNSARSAPGGTKKPPESTDVAKTQKNFKPLKEDEKILHVLNRLGFGPRPGDVQKVKTLGLQKYIDLQLNPDKIDDSALEKKLASFTELQKSDETLASEYHDFITKGKAAKQLNKQVKQANAAANADATPGTKAADTPDGAAAAKTKKAKKNKDADTDMTKEAREMKQEAAETGLPVAMAHKEFMEAKVLRAVESERQLQEVLIDFWSNHFNIDMRKPPCGMLKIMDERDTIYPHVFGKFRDLLQASAKSPAMLVYLDNYQSTLDMSETTTVGRKKKAKADADPASTAPIPAPKKKRMGLNENYAREIMELHTLGVDGGYTQQDVHEVARCFTGWSITGDGTKRPATGKYAEAGQFHFYPKLHDDGAKTVLGQTIPAGGGILDGEKVLEILATNPATMRHVSFQLCQRLVADEPPTSLVDKCVATWKKTDGDLREVVRTIVSAPEFYAPSSYRAKIKSPFEYAVSSVRALGGTCDSQRVEDTQPKSKEANYMINPPKGGGFLDIDTTTLVGQIGTMGQPLFQYQAPTGYPEDSRKWVSSGALIARLNYSLALTAGKLTDLELPQANKAISTTGDANHLIDQLGSQILHSSVSPATRATLLKQVHLTADDTMASGVSSARIAALLLGSPEFQRH